PTVSITSPVNGATFTAPANITINANASVASGTITRVEFCVILHLKITRLFALQNHPPLGCGFHSSLSLGFK
ncbi:MAG: Ig-like domain-containing protein, partial [Burkholderiales bacterium]|nr:Ig-like domain-containing protein [Burkholderiales bacterium]